MHSYLLHRSFLNAIAVAAVLTLVAPACADDWLEVRGILEHYPEDYPDDSAYVELPDRVAVGVPAAITVRTIGSYCDRQGPTRHSVHGLLVVIEPYDLIPAPGSGGSCIDITRRFLHTVHVAVPQPGAATVLVIGRRLPGDTLMTVERTLTVQ